MKYKYIQLNQTNFFIKLYAKKQKRLYFKPYEKAFKNNHDILKKYKIINLGMITLICNFINYKSL